MSVLLENCMQALYLPYCRAFCIIVRYIAELCLLPDSTQNKTAHGILLLCLLCNAHDKSMSIHIYVLYDQCYTIICLIAKKNVFSPKWARLFHRAHYRKEAIGKPLHPIAESRVCFVLFLSPNQHHLTLACLRSGLPLR